MSKETPQVGLFVTCLVDLFRPTVGFAAVKLLEDAGCNVEVPPTQTCCGQPAFNAGDRPSTVDIAKSVVTAFESFEYVVAPSGSCAGMLKKHYPTLFEDEPVWAARAEKLAAKCFELVSFLSDVLKVETVSASHDGSVTYHDSCAGLRELDVHDQPRQLLASVTGLDVIEHDTANVCCGFGGTFCVKYPEISTRMVSDKTAAIVATGATTVLAGDMGCLLNIAGRMSREGHDVSVRHVAEVLADMSDRPAIGAPADRRS